MQLLQHPNVFDQKLVRNRRFQTKCAYFFKDDTFLHNVSRGIPNMMFHLSGCSNSEIHDNDSAASQTWSHTFWLRCCPRCYIQHTSFWLRQLRRPYSKQLVDPAAASEEYWRLGGLKNAFNMQPDPSQTLHSVKQFWDPGWDTNDIAFLWITTHHTTLKQYYPRSRAKKTCDSLKHPRGAPMVTAGSKRNAR